MSKPLLLFFLFVLVGTVFVGAFDGVIITVDGSTDLWDLLDTPADINLTDLGDVNASTPGDGEVLVYNSTTNSWTSGAAGSGTGDITSVTAGSGLYGGGASGGVTLYVNASTCGVGEVSKFDGDQFTCVTDATGGGGGAGKNTTGFYLFNDSNTIYVNETQLNATIDSRATSVGDGTGGWTNTSVNTTTGLSVFVTGGSNVTSNWFFGLFDLFVSSNYLTMNGSTLTLADTTLNTDFNNTNMILSVNTTTNIENLGFVQGSHTGTDEITLALLNITGTDDNACTGTDKVTNVSFVDGVLSITCDTDSTGSGGFTTDQNDELNTTGAPTFNNITFGQWLTTNFYLQLAESGSDLVLSNNVGGVNSFFIQTTGTFLEMVANPGVTNGYLMLSIQETQGDDTQINFYEGGTGHNRFWDSGSARFGGGESYLCSNLTTDVDCDTAGTGADVVVQDDIWAGGKVFATDWSDVNNAVTLTEANITDLSHTGNDEITVSILNITGVDSNACSTGNFVNNVTLLNGDIITSCDAPAGSGDITAVYGNDEYVINGSASGDVYLALNATVLNNDFNQTSLALSINTTTNIENLGFVQGSHTTDTNETSRVEFLTGTDCEAGQLVIGVQNNGTVLCATDQTGSGSAIDQNVNSTANVTFYSINSTVWTNVTITESQISDLAHTGNNEITLTEANITDLNHITNDEITLSILNITGTDDNACTGTNKVTNVSFVDGALSITCDTDVDTGGGDFYFANFTTAFNANYTAATWSYNQTTPAINYCDATFEPLLSNEAGLYSALSDVTEFLETGDAATLATLNTGFGANELYAMNQNVTTTSRVVYSAVNSTGNITASDRVCFNTDCSSYIYNNGTDSIWK